MLFILKCLYFFLPAYFANMAPVLFKWIPLGNKPLHNRLFGKNKTWRGLVVAIFMGALIFWLQRYFYLKGFERWAIIDYGDFSILLGVLMGAGVILGDLVKSYYKRKNNLKPGQPWPVWDQLDFVFGGLLLSFFVYIPRVEVALVLLIISPILHIAANHIGYWLKIQDVKW